MDLPATCLLASYTLNASGLSESRPSKPILPMPGKYSFAPMKTVLLMG